MVGLDLKTDGTIQTPREYENLYMSHKEAFWGEQSDIQRGPKWRERAGKADWLWSFIVAMGWSWGYS